MDRPGICLIGCGRIAAAHAGRLKGRARLFFHSRREESAVSLNREAGGDGTFADLNAALGSNRVDAVMITTPPEAHTNQVVRALEADKTVFVEKPMCMDAGEIARISAAVGNRPLMVGENYYYKPSLAIIKGWIDDGDVGEVERISVRKCFAQPSTGWKSAHGSLFEGGIHFIALLNGMFGAPSSVDAASFPNTSESPERHAIVSLSYGNATAELEYGWDTPSLTKGVFQHSYVNGSEGRIVFESNGIYARLTGRRACLRFPGFGDLMGAGAMMDDFLQMIETGRPPISGLDRAREDLETVFRAYELGGVGSPSMHPPS